MHILIRLLSLFTLLACSQLLTAQDTLPNFDYLDVFALEHVREPQISPDGEWVVYRRMGFDILKDRAVGNLWLVKTDGSAHQKLTTRERNESRAQWSPTGDRIAFVSNTEQGSEVFVYWFSTGKLARLTQLESSPNHLRWSPDGQWLAFIGKVAQAPPVIAKMPPKPKGAKWAGTPRITDRLKHEADGSGYVKPGFTHLFVIPAEGGSARQVSNGDYNHSGPIAWSADGAHIYCSGNRSDNWEYDYRNSEIYQVAVQNGATQALTNRKGPDYSPIISPDGQTIAYLSFEDKVQAYQNTEICLMQRDGSKQHCITEDLDFSFSNIRWAADGQSLYCTYDSWGDTKIARISTEGKLTEITDQIGGTSLGRPYASGSYSVANNGRLAFTHTLPSHPADLAILSASGAKPTTITQLNKELLNYRTLGQVEEVRYKSSFDGRAIQGWIVKPPHYEEGKTYPLLVENHGGPILNYGNRFSVEMQLYAAAGYLVFYPNPRGSTGYGEEFANLLFNNYPGEDYQDVMDGVDHLIAQGLTSEDQLYVTGGSAGGIMTAWIVGKNDRFEAAVVAKPVVNWISKTLVADNYFYYADYRIKDQPWENVEDYWRFSPLSLVGNINTPTMVMVGMNDLRTPPSEAKQLYHALKIRKVETVLVEIPEASHGIAARPSNLITKIAHTLAWFEQYRDN